MFKFNELDQLHLEVSNNCQASCPMCIRNIHGGAENPLVKLEDWSLEKYKTIISEEVIAQVKLIYFCGNYGDPLLNKDLLEMIRYTVSVKPDIVINIHTNGSLRGKQWWADLAHALPKEHRVIFGIDGIGDTHSIYRVGTSYNKIIENASAFITAGGRAEWAFIRFKHNEHQVGDAKEKALALGFEEFTMKDSSRFLMETKYPVYNKHKETIYNLEPSQYSEIKFIDKKVIDNYKEVVKQTPIKCFAVKHKEAYITAQGHLFPCCWLAMIPYQVQEEAVELLTIRQDILAQYNELVESLGGISALDAGQHTIKDIINSPAYQTVWDYYWNERKLITCVRSCGVQPEVFSTPRDQFVSTTQFN